MWGGREKTYLKKLKVSEPYGFVHNTQWCEEESTRWLTDLLMGFFINRCCLILIFNGRRIFVLTVETQWLMLLFAFVFTIHFYNCLSSFCFYRNWSLYSNTKGYFLTSCYCEQIKINRYDSFSRETGQSVKLSGSRKSSCCSPDTQITRICVY